MESIGDQRVREHIARTVEDWPDLTQAQLDRLAILFRDEGNVEPSGADALADMMGDE